MTRQECRLSGQATYERRLAQRLAGPLTACRQRLAFMMVKPVSVEARPGYRIYIRYSDGAAGEIDLSEFAGRGVFSAWLRPGEFEQVQIGEHRQVRWNEEAELCPDALYLRLTGKTPEEYFAEAETASAHA